MKYKCPKCKENKMEKRVYTEERCECGYVNHHPHKIKVRRKPPRHWRI